MKKRIFTLSALLCLGGASAWAQATATTQSATTDISLTPVANTSNKTWTFNMPAYNVELVPEFYPVAEFTAEPTANTAKLTLGASTPLVTAGETTQGTVAYAVSNSTTAPTEGWSTTVPTAANLTATGAYFVWYQIIGGDEYSNTDPAYVTVTLEAAPVVTIASYARSFTLADAGAVITVNDQAVTLNADAQATVVEGSTIKIAVPKGYYIEGNWYANVAPEVVMAKDTMSFTTTMPAENMELRCSIVRDLAYASSVETPALVRLEKNYFYGSPYSYAEGSEPAPAVYDVIGTAPVAISGGFYTTLQKSVKDEEGNWTWEDYTGYAPVPGNYRFVIEASTDYAPYQGIIYSDTLEFYEGYLVNVAAKSFATYHDAVQLTISPRQEEGASMHFITSITADSVFLSPAINVAYYNAPILLYNDNDEAMDVELVPAEAEEADEVTAVGFYLSFHRDYYRGAGSLEYYNYFVLTAANAFVHVKDPGTLPAHRWGLIFSKEVPVKARVIAFQDETTGIETIEAIETLDTDAMYDVTGRKLNKKPASGIVIQQGKKVILK